MTNVVNFRRSDGIEFSAEEGSAAFELMTKDGAFTQIGGETPVVSGQSEPDVAGRQLGGGSPTGEPVLPNFTKMKKAELVAYAESIGLEVVPDSLTNKLIIEAIEAKLAEEPAEAGTQNDAGTPNE